MDYFDLNYAAYNNLEVKNGESKEYLNLLSSIFISSYHNKEVKLTVYIFKLYSLNYCVLKNLKNNKTLKGSVKFKYLLDLLNEVYHPIPKDTKLETLRFKTLMFNTDLERVGSIIKANKNIEAFLKKYEN